MWYDCNRDDYDQYDLSPSNPF
jgi:ribonucleotide monophosphatase NagD (HAD superfamily)